MPATLYTAQKSGDGNHGLARPDLSLQQSMHRVGCGQIGLDLADDPPLRPGQLVGQPGDESCDQLAGGVVRHPRGFLDLSPLLDGQRQLEAEQLVIHQTVPGRCDLIECFGKVDRVEGRVPRHEAMGVNELPGHRVIDRAGPLEGIVNGAADRAQLELGHSRVNRDHSPGAQALQRRVEDINLGALHLQRPAKRLDYPGQRDSRPLGELLEAKALVEPDGLHDGGLVGNSRFDDAEAPPWPPVADGNDLPYQRYFLADRGLSYRRLLRSVDVATGDVVEEIGHVSDPELGELLRALWPKSLELAGLDCGELRK